MASHPTPKPEPDPAFLLNRGLTLLSAVHVVALAVAALALSRAGWPATWSWLGSAAAVAAGNLGLLWANRRRLLTGANLRSIWGPANRMTASRGLLAALLAGFLSAPPPTGPLAWVPALLYTAIACLDSVDGWWARRSGTQTRMGEILDQEYDALGIAVAVLLSISHGKLPVFFAVVAAARYLFVLGLAVRRKRGLAERELPPSCLRRRLAGFQMGVLAVFLWPIARPPATTLAGTIVSLPLLLGFVRDWLLVTGRIAPNGARYLALKRVVYRTVRKFLSPLARMVLAAAAGWILWELARGGSALPPAAAADLPWQLPRAALLLTLAAGQWVTPAALTLLVLESARVFVAGFDPLGALVIASTLLLGLFGAGTGRLIDGLRGMRRLRLRDLLWLPVPPLLYWALRDLRLRDLGALLGRLEAAELAVLLALNLLFLAVLTARWWVILRGLGARLSFAATAAYRLAGFAVSYLTPGPQTGGEPLQVYLAARHPGVSYATASASLLLDKSYELCGNFFFLALGCAAAASLRILPAAGAAALLLAPLALLLPPALYLAALMRGRRPLSALLAAIGRRRPRLRARPAARRLLHGVLRSERQLVRYARRRSRVGLELAAFFLLTWASSVLEMTLVLRFLGVEPGLLRVVFVLTAGRLAFLLPLPAALGALEISQVGAFGLLGYGPEVALSLVVYVRARDLLFAAAGALISLTALRRGAVGPRPPSAARQPASQG